MKTTSRTVKLNKIGQAHLAPGMSLAKWQEILRYRHVGRSRKNWLGVPDADIDAIIADVAEVVRSSQNGET